VQLGELWFGEILDDSGTILERIAEEFDGRIFALERRQRGRLGIFQPGAARRTFAN